MLKSLNYRMPANLSLDGKSHVPVQILENDAYGYVFRTLVEMKPGTRCTLRIRPDTEESIRWPARFFRENALVEIKWCLPEADGRCFQIGAVPVENYNDFRTEAATPVMSSVFGRRLHPS